jgi:hypothetical protein
MAAELITLPFRPVINLRGGLESGATLDVFATGTTTPVSVFADAALATPLTNPVVADAFGVFPTVYYDDALTVRVRVKQANGTVLNDTDPYSADPASAEASADAAAASASIAVAASGPLYGSIAAGLAATADQDEFAVDNGDGTASIYLDNAGSEVLRRTIIIDPANAGTAALLGTADGGNVQQSVTKLGQFTEIRDSGATGLNAAGDAAALDTLLGAVTPGQTIRATRTSAAAAAFKRTDSSFVLSRAVDLEFENGVALRVDQTAGERDNVLNVDVLLSNDETSPSSTGEWRGGWIRGGKLFTNALTGTQVASGGYGIAVHSGTSKSIIGLTIEKQTIGGGLGSVLFSSLFNRTGSGNETQWCQVVRCTLDGTLRFEGEDGLIAVDCIAIGNASGAPAYEWDMTQGAFCSGVFRGTTAGVGGAAQIKNGSFVKLHNVQMEHSGTAATGLAGGAQITILGQDYKSYGVEIIGCNLGAGAYVTNTINLFNASGTVIDRCQFNIADGGSSADVNLNRDATDAADDTDNTIVGYANTFRGARSVQSAGALTDVSRRMVLAHTGGAMRKQHRGIWFPVFDLITSQASDLAQSGLECMVDHSGAIRFNGCFTRATFFTNGLTVGTLPSWLAPHAIHRFPVVGTSGAAAVGVVLTNGAFGIEGTGLASSTELWIPNGAWNVVVNPDYVDPDA